MKASRLLAEGVAALKRSKAIDHWQRGREAIEAEELLLWAIRGDEYDPHEEFGPAVERTFRGYIRRRAAGEPVQLITGFTEFRGLEVFVAPGVFVPRDSSEFLAEQCVRRLRTRENPVFVELACGAGAVSLAVRNETWGTTVYGADIAADAIRTARRSARSLRLRANFVVGDLYGGLPKRLKGSVDVIAIHPPYVAKGELRDLPIEIRGYEPPHTLSDRSVDGLGLLRRAARGSHDWLRPGGWFLVEVSPDRSRAVAAVLRQEGLRDISITKGGELKITRVVCAKR
ncbi:MAG: N5-glutamine methyltransferase family protein [Actinomycetota bacterium]